MRTSQEVRDELADIKRNYGEDETKYTQEIAGWVEALEWVLSDYKGEE
jgi:hypothetical protein